MSDERPIPSTADTLVYIVVTYYLIALFLSEFDASAHPILILGAAMAIVFAFMKYDLYPRAESKVKELINY